MPPHASMPIFGQGALAPGTTDVVRLEQGLASKQGKLHGEGVGKVGAGTNPVRLTARAHTSGSSYIKYVALVLQVVQTTALVLLMRTSMTKQAVPYLKSTAVVMVGHSASPLTFLSPLTCHASPDTTAPCAPCPPRARTPHSSPHSAPFVWQDAPAMTIRQERRRCTCTACVTPHSWGAGAVWLRSSGRD